MERLTNSPLDLNQVIKYLNSRRWSVDSRLETPIDYDRDNLEKQVASTEEILKSYEEAVESAPNDHAYWGYLMDKTYWSAVVDTLKAALIVGPDNLPNLELALFPDGTVVMDAASNMDKFGKEMLRQAKAAQANENPGNDI